MLLCACGTCGVRLARIGKRQRARWFRADEHSNTIHAEEHHVRAVDVRHPEPNGDAPVPGCLSTREHSGQLRFTRHFLECDAQYLPLPSLQDHNHAWRELVCPQRAEELACIAASLKELSIIFKTGVIFTVQNHMNISWT